MPHLSWCQKLGSLTLVLAVCVCLAGAGSPAGGNKLKQENFAKIKNDMAEKDVIELLGKPAVVQEEEVHGGGKVKLALWHSGRDIIAVTFKDSKVIVKAGTFVPPTDVDALVKEHKAIIEEAKNSKGDPAKLKAILARQVELGKKISSLTDAQKREYFEKMLKDRNP
jgi:outer membrane protein assembly factor BamE (lipoprotein component of BamABCDE complex)